VRIGGKRGKCSLRRIHREHLGAKGRDVRREEPWERGSAGLGASSAVLAKKLAAEKASPSEAAAASERRKALADALEEMDPLDREVIALRAFEMLSVPEAARVLGIRPGAARTRYWRALKRLKALLEDKGQTEEAE
jgi:RNA polymerase sigma-70 factor (ECF subfamily)